MPANLNTAVIKVTGGTSGRTLANHLGDVVNVKDFGAVGDNSNDDTAEIQAALDYAYGTTASPHGDTNATSNRAVFFPAGHYKITAPLTLRSVKGAHIFGSGRFTTVIENDVANSSVFVTNGCTFSTFEMMYLTSNGSGVCFDLDWDNTGNVSLQSNTFRDLYMEGGAYGLRIGESGFMGSENMIINCFFGGFTTAGIATRNGNALQQSVYGGNIASCAKGICVTSAGGSVPIIHGVGFQNQTTADISIEWAAGDNYSIHGCRNETNVNNTSFIILHAGASAHINGCTQNNEGTTGQTFCFIESGAPRAGPGTVTIENCYSCEGAITGNGFVYIRGNPAIQRPIAISAAADNGAGLIRLTVSSTAAWTTGQSHYVWKIVGTGNVSAANNNFWTITVIDPTHIDLQGSTFSGTYTSGGVVDGQMFGNPSYLATFTGTVVENI